MRPPVRASNFAVMLSFTALSASAHSRRAVSIFLTALQCVTRGRLFLVFTSSESIRSRRLQSVALQRNTSRLLRATCSETHALLIIALLLIAPVAQAQTQSETRFEYDGAGNIVRIVNEANDAPPTVTSLTPNFINRGSSVLVVASGNNLVLADVSSVSPDLEIDRVTATRSSVRFRLRASLDAPIGPATLTFSTRLGTASADIFVAERTPIISTIPNPIVLAANSQPVLVTLLFDQPFETDQVYQVSIRDTSIATVQELSVTLPAGGREVQVNLTGVSVGTTTFDISQPENFIGLGISVIVVPDDPLPAGNYEISAPAIGVVINVDGPLIGPLSAESEAVGVVVNVDEPFSGAAAGLSEEVGVAFGATGASVSPANFTVGTIGTLTITGNGLDEVIAVSFFPGDDITQTGPLSVDPDGSVLNVPLSVAPGASTGVRAIVLTTSSGDVGLEVVLEITP